MYLVAVHLVAFIHRTNRKDMGRPLGLSGWFYILGSTNVGYTTVRPNHCSVQCRELPQCNVNHSALVGPLGRTSSGPPGCQSTCLNHSIHSRPHSCTHSFTWLLSTLDMNNQFTADPLSALQLTTQLSAGQPLSTCHSEHISSQRTVGY